MIDDLVKFCLTEVAYEGELGCTIARLKELITRFSDTPLASSSLDPPTDGTGSQKDQKKTKQNVDDAYCAYVFSLIVKHPSIVIGTVPDGTPPVWIAPPPHKKGQAPPPPPVSLNVISDAKEKLMRELEEAYGTQLRIAADKVACFVALTGSHNRPSRLSDTVYTTLQVITRTREKGIAIKDLGPITKYDPKSIFYQIAQLVDMNLVVKVSKSPSLNWAVLKKFYDRSLLWQKIVGEKDEESDAGNENDDFQSNNGDESEQADLVANVPLLRYRVLKLIEQSTNQIHQYNNMIVSAGFANPTKSQRRFFTSRLNEMIQEELLEKFGVPTDRGTAVCVKLTDKGRDLLRKRNLEPEVQPSGKFIDECTMNAEIDDEEFTWTEDMTPSRCIGLQRQIIDLLDANPSGLIIREIATSLGNFDRRTIEQVLTRLCTRIPPRHLADLHPVTVMETEGKMRRQRYFIIRHYRQLLQEQNLPDDRYNWLHTDDVGTFAHVDEAMIWKTPEDIAQYITRIQESRGRKARDPNKPSNAKKKVLKNPIINGVPKRGRPKKDQSATTNGDEKAKPTKKRAPKRKATEMEIVVEDGSSKAAAANGETPTVEPPAKPTKSRKKKKTEPPIGSSASTVEQSNTNAPAMPTSITANKDANMVDATPSTGSLVPSGPTNSLPATRAKPPKVGPKKGKKRAVDEGDVLMPPKKKQRVTPVVPMPEIEPDVLDTPQPNVQPPESATAGDLMQVAALAIEPTSNNPAPAPDPPPRSPTRPHRRPKQQKPRATNVSELRRQQEIMDVLLANDGIMQLNTEMAIHLRDHVQELAETGVQTGQGAGFLSDKKTISRSVTALEEKGQVKVMKTVILDPNRKGSLQQPTTIIYRPGMPQEKIQAFLVSLQKPYKPTIQIPVVPLAMNDAVAFSKSIRPMGLTPKEDSEPPSMSAAAIIGPRQQFLEDRQTIAQLFGFLLGKSRRAQELYLFTLSHILSDSPPLTVISVEERIVSTNYWTEDYPLGSFCAIIPAQLYIPYLEVAQTDPEALNKPLRSLNASLRRGLKTKHARTRIRLMEICAVLHALQLITPLKDSPDGSIIPTDAREDIPKSFAEVEMPTGSNPTPPKFWRFNKQVPLWLLGRAKFTSHSIETEPPFYKEVPVSTVDEAVAYWSLLQRVCDRQGDFTAFEVSATPPRPLSISPTIITSLCHYRGWTADYRLSKLQEEYLKRMVDVSALTTPLSDPTPDRLMQAAFITCAPQQVIYAYFSKHAERLESTFERMERKKQKAAGVRVPRDALHKSMVHKAKKHLQDLGDKWDQLVKDLVEGELGSENEEKLRPLRSRYIAVGGVVDQEKLKELIENVIRNPVESVRRRYQKVSSKSSTSLPPEIQMEHIEEAMPEINHIFRSQNRNIGLPALDLDSNGFPPLPPLISHQAARSVAEIVDEMGTAPAEVAPLSKKDDHGPKEIVGRRKRFSWNDEYDELLRDTVAIIRARCREKTRGVRWQPAEAVFPPVRANNLRTHFNKYLTQPGAASYMDRLEKGWYVLWQTHKGRPELPDSDPSTPEGCDLITHVDFLRKYLDKRRLVSHPDEVDEVFCTTQRNQSDLPLELHDLNNLFHVEDQSPPILESILQQYWGDLPAYLNERTHTVSAVAFAERPALALNDPSLEQSVAESAIQMIVATEQESYKEEVATALLVPFGEEIIKMATHALWKRGTISKIPKSKVGRGYRMSESNAEDLTGKVPVQRIEDAAAIETVFQEDPDEWRSWAINASEGEMAAFLYRASRHEVEFKIQMPDLKMARDIAQWTSRKIQDEMLETRIDVLFTQPELSNMTPSEDDIELPNAGDDPDKALSPETRADSTGHGKNCDGKAASCLILHGAGQLVNCLECLQVARVSLLAQHPPMESNILALLDELEKLGKNGLLAEDVWVSQEFSSAMPSVVHCIPPLAFWSGYTRSRLVSARFLGSYAVWLSNDGEKSTDVKSRLVMPRRWTDLNGDTVLSTWNSAVRAVVGLLLTRALIDHVGLIQHFNKAYDRLDILTVLEHLEDKGVVRIVQLYPKDEGFAHKVGQMTLEEERHTFWELDKDFEWRMLL